MKKKDRRRLDRFIAQTFDLCCRFARWAHEDGWAYKHHAKRLNDEKYDGVYRVPCVELTKGKVHLMVEADGPDICGVDGGSLTVYRMPHYENHWRIMCDGGVWTIVNIDEHPDERQELPLDEENFMLVVRLLNAPWPDLKIGDKVYRDEAFYPPAGMVEVPAAPAEAE